MDLMTRMLEMVIGRSGASERVVERFMTPGAVSPDKAIPFTPLGDRQRTQFELLQKRGAIMPAGNRYYLDQGAFDAMRARDRRVRGAVFVAVAAVLVAGVVALR
jgi:hypothetical protein